MGQRSSRSCSGCCTRRSSAPCNHDKAHARELALRAAEKRATEATNAGKSLNQNAESPIETVFPDKNNSNVSSSSTGTISHGAHSLRSRATTRAGSIAVQSRDALLRAAAVRTEMEAERARRAEELHSMMHNDGLLATGVLQRIAVGVANGPTRCYINHSDFSQSYWDSGNLMDYSGFRHDFGFWAFTAFRPCTKRIAVGIAGGRVTVGVERCLINPSNRQQTLWDSGEEVSDHGFTPQLSFWAFSSPQPGTVRITVHEPYDSSVLHSCLVCTDTLGSSSKQGSAQISGFRWVHEFWAFPDPGPLSKVPPGDETLQFSKHVGYISGGGDLLQARMTVEQAKEKCKHMRTCQGFTFQGEDEQGQVDVCFKDKWDLCGVGWTSFRCYRGDFDPDSAAEAMIAGLLPSEYEEATAMLCLSTEQLQKCVIIQKAEFLHCEWGHKVNLPFMDLVRTVAYYGFSQAGIHGEYFVMQHIDSGRVEGSAFATLQDAVAKFQQLDGGPHATMLADSNFHELQYYGLRGYRLDDFESWWGQNSERDEVYVEILHDDAAPRVGLIAQLQKLWSPEARKMLQDWRVDLLPMIFTFLNDCVDVGDTAASLLLLAYCSWRLFDGIVCPVIARRAFDRCIFALKLPSDGVNGVGEDARSVFREWVSNYIELHKDKALSSAFLEPSKLYWRRVLGASVQEHDVDAHAVNVFAGLLDRTLGVRCPMPVSWDDWNAVHGVVEFFRADFLHGAMRAMERLENFGQSFAKLIRQSDEADQQARPVPLAGVRFVFAGARSPEELAARALCPGHDRRQERERLRPYLERFARFFERDFFMEAACTAALADDLNGGSHKCAEVLRLLSKEDPDFIKRQAKCDVLPADDDALCRELLWDFDDNLFPTFNTFVASRLFEYVGGILADASVNSRRRSHPGTLWRYTPANGTHMDVRMEPDINAARSGASVEPGELLWVCEERHGANGICYLKLEDGRGWVFDHKPGAGIMCTPCTSYKHK